jgi:hypothetical protein
MYNWQVVKEHIFSEIIKKKRLLFDAPIDKIK